MHLKKAACLGDQPHLQDCSLMRVAAAFREAESQMNRPLAWGKRVSEALDSQVDRRQTVLGALLCCVPRFHLNRSPAEGGDKARQLQLSGFRGQPAWTQPPW